MSRTKSRTKIGRRGFLAASAATAALGTQTKAAAAADAKDTFQYAVTRSDAEWKERLSDIEYFVLRRNGTEAPRSHPYWMSSDVGTYCCKGCDLTIYRSLQKLELDRGFVFFRHSEENAVLTALDTGGADADDPFVSMQAMMEVHCRRCGSHLGHMVALPEVKNRPIHCINGHSLNFEPAAV